MLPTSCRKNSDLISNFTLVAEGLDGDAKLAVNGASAQWVNNEKLNINGEEKTITVSSGTATIADVQRTGYYRAVYPSSIVSGSLSSNNVTVNLPATYQYQLDGSGKQLLATPMAAYLADDSVENSTNNMLFFKHITGAIVVRVTNGLSASDNFNLVIDQVTVTSDNYNISGNVTVNMTDIDNVSPVSGGNSVSMVFTTTNLSIARNASADIQIPVAAVGASNHFTIKVATHFVNSGGNTKYVTYERTQSVGGELGRGQIGYAMVTVGRGREYCVEDLPMEWDDNAYIITSPAHYLAFVEAVNSNASTAHGNATNVNYRLGNNINMSGITVSPLNSASGTMFKRTFDGAGYTISNLHVVSDGSVDAGSIGMFTKRNSYAYPLATNLTLQNVTLEYTGDNVSELNVGAIVGVLQPNSSVTDISGCTVNGMTLVLPNQTSQKNIGGIVGSISGGQEATISSCTVSGALSFAQSTVQSWYFGGVVGNVNSVTTLSSCNFTPSSMTSIAIGGTIRYGGMVCSVTGKNITISGGTAIHNFVTTGGSSSCRIAGLVASLQSTASTATLSDITIGGTIRCKSNSTKDPVANNITSYTINSTNVNTTGFTFDTF